MNSFLCLLIYLYPFLKLTKVRLHRQPQSFISTANRGEANEQGINLTQPLGWSILLGFDFSSVHRKVGTTGSSMVMIMVREKFLCIQCVLCGTYLWKEFLPRSSHSNKANEGTSVNAILQQISSAGHGSFWLLLFFDESLYICVYIQESTEQWSNSEER